MPYADPERYREYQRQYQRQHRERLAARVRERRENDPAFRVAARERSRRWREANREKKNADSRRWAAENREEERARGRRYREALSAERRQATEQRKRRWNAANRDKVAAQQARSREANREQRRASFQRWRSALVAAESESWTPAEIYERDEWRCRIGDCRCPEGRAIDPEAVPRSRWAPTIDHVRPLSRGGSNLKANLQAAHFACNAAKGARED